VVVNPSGKLGVVMSSARFKRDIDDMDEASSNLMKLRPVTFHYKNDPERVRQYGLVAEEVARIYPELVSYGPGGRVETVNYLTLTSMLLNELQKQTKENQRQSQQLTRQAEQLATLSDQMAVQRAAFEVRLSALERIMSVQNRNRNLTAAFNR
jgi:Chaperone of endosialidase